MSRLALEVQRMVDEIYKRAPHALRPRAQPQAVRTSRLRPSPRTTAKSKAAATVISDVRTAVFALDPACICGRCKPSQFDHMHEIVPRSKTRGRPPKNRFNVQNCVRLSRKCHAMLHGEVGRGKQLTLECLDLAAGAMGPIRGTFTDGRTFTYQRKKG